MMTSTKPYQVKASDLKPVWHVIDAEGKTLGRLASEIATLLMGKHKPTYVSHLNTGDFVVVVNADKIRVTGRKLEQKVYYRHSGYHGGLKRQTLEDLLRKAPTRVIRHAVRGMLPKNIMGRRMLSRLKLYAGAHHPHEAQVNAGAKKEKTTTPDKAAKSATATMDGEVDTRPVDEIRDQPSDVEGDIAASGGIEAETGAEKGQETEEA